MIRTIDIFGLFSQFDYKISLPANGEQLILTGPNGYGKTTVLSAIKALCSLDLLYFYSIPFKCIRVYYDKYELDIVSIKSDEKSSEDDQVEIHSGINFILVDSVSKKNIATLFTDRRRITEIEESLDWRKYIDSTARKGNLAGGFFESLRREDAASRKKRSDILEGLAQNQTVLGPFMIMMRSLSVKAKFVEAQRLMNPVSDSSVEIHRVASNMSDYLKSQYFRFLKNSQAHDSQFINRLMNEMESISQKEYDEKKTMISEFVDIANRFDLGANFSIPSYDSSKAGILKSYFDDLIEKISVYVEPVKNLGLFEKLVEDKKFVGKKCVFSRRDGIRFVADSDSSNIPLDVLSSGEKNQLIMLHDFIFNIENDSILLIDEPEISLHVAWQHEFMKDIAEIAKEKGLSVIIATHSPQIIGSRWNECLDLYEMSESHEVFS